MSLIGRLFMDISTVTGEATDDKFKGQIELNSWKWELARKPEQDGSRSKPEPSVFTFTKSMDKSSTQMLEKLKSGNEVKATVTLMEASDLPFQLIVHLKNVRIIDYSMSGDDDEKKGHVKETWVLNYDEIMFEHTPEPAKGEPQTITSNPLERRPHASTDRIDPVQEIMDRFASLDASDQDDVISKINKDFVGAITGPLPKAPDSLKRMPKVDRIKQVVQGFAELKKDDRANAAKQMKDKFLDAFK